MRTTMPRWLLGVGLALLLTGCEGLWEGEDAPDGGTPGRPWGRPSVEPPEDTGSDAGTPRPDGGSDAGTTPRPDGGVDTTRPDVPRWAEGNPRLGNQNRLRLRLYAEPGSRVELFQGTFCLTGSPPLSHAQADASGLATVELEVSSNFPHSFVARAVDAAGNVSFCSDAHHYTEDSLPPPVPEWAWDNPTLGDGNALTLGVYGKERFTTVALYGTADCTGPVLATAPSGSYERIHFPVTVEDDSTHHYSLDGVDSAGNRSACSLPHTYVEDSRAPQKPVLLSTEPGSPASEFSPDILGTAEPGSTLILYRGAQCESSSTWTVTVDAQGRFRRSATVATNTTNHYSARARDAVGHLSECSDALTYVHDNLSPGLPAFSGFSPTSPANHNAPVLAGHAEAGAELRLFAGPSCTGAPVLTQQVEASGQFRVAPSVADDSSSVFSARAVDAAGNVSWCVATSTFVEDSTAPARPSGLALSPASPSSTNAVALSGTVEAGTTALLFTTPGCEGTPVASTTTSASGTGTFRLSATVPDDSLTAFFVAARDAAGNTSACAGPLEYREDSSPPDTTAVLVVDGPAEDVDVQLAGDSAEAHWGGFADAGGGLVYEHTLSRARDCSGTAVTPAHTTAGTSVRLTGLSLAEGTYFHCVRARDAAGNLSARVASDGFRVDLQPPTVVATLPQPHDTSVDLSSDVSFTFSEPVDASTVTAEGVLTVESNGRPVAGRVACADALTCAFSPTHPLPYAEQVIATLSTAVRDVAGRPLASTYTLAFTTRGRQWLPSLEPTPVHTERPGLVPEAAMDDAGHALAVWVQGEGDTFRPYASHALAFGPWGPPRSLDTTNPGRAERPAVAMNGAGSGVAVWELHHGAGVDLYAAEFDSATGWSAPRLLEGRAGPVSTPRVAVDGRGNVLVVWRQSDGTAESVWTVRRVAGVGWTAPLLLEPGAGATSVPALAANAAGSALVAWSQADTEAGPSHLRVSRYAPDTGWTSPELAAEFSDGGSASAAVSADGSALLVFRRPVDSLGTTVDAYVTRFVPGTGWSAKAARLGATLPGEEPSVALDGQGRALALHTGPNGSGRTLFVHRFTPAGGWQPVELAAGSAGQPSVAADGQGNFHLLWVTHGESDRVWTARFADGGQGLTGLQPLEPEQVGTSKRPRVATGGGAGAVGVWYRDNGTGFSGNLVLSKRYE